MSDVVIYGSMTPAEFARHALATGAGSIIEHHYCPCCKSTGLDRDDMAVSARAEAMYGQPICRGCDDEHLETEDGVWMHRDNAVKDDGIWYSTQEALDRAIEDRADDEDLHRLTAAWR